MDKKVLSSFFRNLVSVFDRRHKYIWICELTGLSEIVGESMMKNAYLPEMSVSLQFVGKILAFIVMLWWLHTNPSNIELIHNTLN